MNTFMKKRQEKIVMVCILLLMIVLFIVMSQCFIFHYFNRHAINDLATSTTTQLNILETQLESEFSSLYFLETDLKTGDDFSFKDHQAKLENYVEYNRLCMLAYADIEGNAISYRGEDMGNVSDREYFSDVITGKSRAKYFYLANPKGADGPRVIFSIPVFVNGEINGVLFESKEIKVLENALFSNAITMDADVIIYDRVSNSIICNSNLSGNGEKTVVDSSIETQILTDIFKEDNAIGSSTTTLKIDGNAYYYSCFPIKGDMAWYLICITDRDVASSVYGGSLKDIALFSYLTIIVFSLVCGYSIFLLSRQIKMNQKEEEAHIFQLETYRQLFEQIDCALVEYDIKNDIITSSESFERIFKGEPLHGPLDVLKEIQKEHSEFGFTELYAEMQLIISQKRTSAFETIVNLDDGSTIWINIVLLPIYFGNKEATHILAAVQDVTEQHKMFDAAVGLINQVPGGLHRCYLSDPIHMEYASPGLVSMLGYTETEFDEKIGTERNFCNLIVEEDRSLFEEFCDRLAENGGTDSCEYRIQDKAGKILYVVDTMDVKRATSGIMYGYSVVTDVSSYYEEKKTMENELKAANDALDHARIRISTSQMQPHFLYNALASIREIVLEDPEYASDLICDFTTHLRSCIRSMNSDEQIPFLQELNNIKAYVNIERMRFGDRLKVEYDINVDDFTIIPLSIQPLVENAIRHGVYERGAKGGLVKIQTAKGEGNSIVISVEDNGVGFDFERIKQEIKDGKKDSTGLINLIFRFKELMNAEVIIDSRIGKGTYIKVIITKEAE